MKIIKEERTKITYKITVKHYGKLFTGKARLHPDDYFSVLRGGDLAYNRAVYKAYAYEYKKKKQEAETCRMFIKSVKDTGVEIPQAFYTQLKGRIKQVNQVADKLNMIELSIAESITSQNVVSERIKRLKARNVLAE